MSRRHGPFATDNPWRTIAWGVVAGLTLGAAATGFLILPAVNRGASQPLWAAICSAIGLAPPSATPAEPAERLASAISWTAAAVAEARTGDPRHGAFVALNCGACHGAEGVNASGWIPNLAGMRPEAMVKQLEDYKSSHRVWPVMEAVAGALSDQSIRDVAAHYAALASARPEQPAKGLVDVSRLITVGDPHRGIAPCSSCHGPDGLKRGAPLLAGQQAGYIEKQLASFQMRTRHNDEGEQMRVVAAQLTPDEIKSLAARYAAASP